MARRLSQSARNPVCDEALLREYTEWSVGRGKAGDCSSATISARDRPNPDRALHPCLCTGHCWRPVCPTRAPAGQLLEHGGRRAHPCILLRSAGGALRDLTAESWRSGRRRTLKLAAETSHHYGAAPVRPPSAERRFECTVCNAACTPLPCINCAGRAVCTGRGR